MKKVDFAAIEGAASSAQGALADTALQPGTATIDEIAGLTDALNSKATSAQGSLADSALQSISRASLKAADQTKTPTLFLNDTYKSGRFDWYSGDISALVALDPNEGIYILKTGVPATTGGWVRRSDGEVWASWFGLDPSNTSANNNAAFLAAANFAKRSWGRLKIGAGNFTFSGEIDIALDGSGYALHIEGQGNGKTRLIFPSGNGIWVTRSNGNWWLFGDATHPANTLTVTGLDFIVTGGTAGVANGVALTYNGNDVVGRPTPTFRIRDCMFTSDDLNYCWAMGIQLLSVSDAEINYCQWFGSPAYANIGRFINLRSLGSGQDASPFHITNCYAYYFEIAVTGESYIEGIHVSDCDFVAGNFGVRYECLSSQESQLVMTGCHVNVTQNAIYLKSVADSQITGNLLWSSGAGQAVINCIDAHSQTITGNEIAGTDANVGTGTGISITAVTYGAATNLLRGSVIDNNVIQYLATGIILGSTIRNYVIGSSNRFAGCTLDVQDQANLNFVGNSIFKNTTATQTGANTTATNLMSVTVPAAYMKPGKRMRFRAYGRTGANTNGKTILMLAGGSSMGGFSTAVSGVHWEMEVIIDILSLTSQKTILRGSVGSVQVATAITLPANNLASDLVLAVQGTNSVATAGDITVDAMSVEILDR